MDPTYPAFPILAFIAFIAPLSVLMWLPRQNTGACIYIFWASLGSLNQFVNAVAWHGHAENFAPVFCDISIRITIGFAVAIPSSLLCIMRRLYIIANGKCIALTDAQKRRALIEDCSIGFGIPVLQMGLQFTVAGHRSTVYEDYGCFPATHNAWPAYIVVYGWPVVIGLTSSIYSVLTLRACFQKRTQLNEIFSNSIACNNHYARLMTFAIIEICLDTPISISMMSIGIAGGVYPYKGWADTHSDYLRVDQIPLNRLRSYKLGVVGLELTRWLTLFCSAIFFALFGFSSEARRSYRTVFCTVWNGLGPKAMERNRISAEEFAARRPHNSLFEVDVSLRSLTEEIIMVDDLAAPNDRTTNDNKVIQEQTQQQTNCQV